MGLADQGDSLFFGGIGQKAEVADAHEVRRQDVEEETADELGGGNGHGSGPGVFGSFL